MTNEALLLRFLGAIGELYWCCVLGALGCNWVLAIDSTNESTELESNDTERTN